MVEELAGFYKINFQPGFEGSATQMILNCSHEKMQYKGVTQGTIHIAMQPEKLFLLCIQKYAFVVSAR